MFLFSSQVTLYVSSIQNALALFYFISNYQMFWYDLSLLLTYSKFNISALTHTHLKLIHFEIWLFVSVIQ